MSVEVDMRGVAVGGRGGAPDADVRAAGVAVRAPSVAVRLEVDALAAARRQLRRQIAVLELRLTDRVIELGAPIVGAGAAGAARAAGAASAGPRIPGLEELEHRRDRLAAHVAQAERRLERRGRDREQARLLLEAMIAEPARHRFVRVTAADLGEGGCGAYEVRPRLGLLGMLAGWWEVKLSSGCP